MAKIGLKKAYTKQKNRFFIVDGKKYTIKEVRAKGVEFIVGNGLSVYFDIEYSESEYKKMGIVSPKVQEKAEKTEALTKALNIEKGKVTKLQNALDLLKAMEGDEKDDAKIKVAKEKMDKAVVLKDKAEKALSEFVGK